jgi:DNA-binding CsgD family transcriptional regulator
VLLDEKDYLAHYGILRRSGRYPYGSGGNESTEQRSRTFLDFVDDLKRRLGWGDTEIAKHLEISTTELRQLRTIAKHEQKAAQISRAQTLQTKGLSNVAIGQKMGINESSVRALLAPKTQEKQAILTTTTDMIRRRVDEVKYLDVGSGTENWVGVSQERLNVALAALREEGYEIKYVRVPQAGKNETTMKILVPPGVTASEVFKNRDSIATFSEHSDDNGRSYFGIVDPLPVSADRLAINYAEDGGGKHDGVIYVRPGVDDISLGGNRYAQVRIKVGDDHYIKGMALYKDDLPDGVDLVFNTNKTDTGNKLDALKPLKDDPDNPFGSYIHRQITEKLPDGTERAVSAMNLVNEEGRWGEWSRTLASQVLSKQSPELARSQLNVTFERRKSEFDEIMSLTNPTVRKKLLEEFADGTDSASVHLKAANLPRQRVQVILPIDTLPNTQIYAPNFNNGERVALIRYPHGGTFEIPELTVNNRHAGARRILGDAKDAVGINAEVASRLSGADFDGDTVLVIPNDSGKVRHSPALQQLRNFDPRSEYPAYEGMRTIDGGHWNASTNSVDYNGRKPNTQRMQREMGDVSNLITDMTIKGATHSEIASAVRHSMVVIDSEKHSLNYRLSAQQNGIPQLKAKYQGRANAGAATLISRAKSPVRVPEIKPRRASQGGPVDPTTGKRVFEPTNRSFVNKQGVTVHPTTSVRKLDLAEDAHTLSSGTPMERLYADHSNRLKAMANEARLAALNTPRAQYSPSAAQTYSSQVARLNGALEVAIRNRPLERNALVLANAIVRQRRDANPNMDPDTLKKIKAQSLEEARRRTGAERTKIIISHDEWDAIQAGAISDSRLGEILRYADTDTVRELATPRTQLLMSPSRISRATAMATAGATRAEIAAALGVSLTTLETALTGGANA